MTERQPKRTRRPIVEYSNEKVWAAAFAAYRVNKGYHKAAHNANNPECPIPQHVKMRNVDLMKAHLTDDLPIEKEDYAAAEKARSFVQGYSVLMLMGKTIGDFRMGYLNAVEKNAWSSVEYMALGSMAYLPTFMEKEYVAAAREEEMRTKSETGFLGDVGERIVFIGKVMRNSYSQKYNVFYVTVLTTSGKVCWFSFSKHVEVGAEYRFAGTVKRHTEDCQTQMTRVRFS